MHRFGATDTIWNVNIWPNEMLSNECKSIRISENDRTYWSLVIAGHCDFLLVEWAVRLNHNTYKTQTHQSHSCSTSRICFLVRTTASSARRQICPLQVTMPLALAALLPSSWSAPRRRNNSRAMAPWPSSAATSPARQWPDLCKPPV
jgi:hypothetical protein